LLGAEDWNRMLALYPIWTRLLVRLTPSSKTAPWAMRLAPELAIFAANGWRFVVPSG